MRFRSATALRPGHDGARGNGIWTPDLGAGRGATKHQRLTDRIIVDIESGVLAPGARMPAHRDLAHRIKVSVQTISIAYKEAEQLGYLSGEAVIEDEVCKPLADEPLPSIAALIPDFGFFVTSFTKSVMTGLRSGYLVVPPAYSTRVSSILRVTGWTGTNLMAEMAARDYEPGARCDRTCVAARPDFRCM